MAEPDLYAVLGISPTADQLQIRAAFRRLARAYHPDRAGSGSAAQMIAINHAYAVLSDPERRARYDASRSSSDASRRSAGARGRPPAAGRRSGDTPPTTVTSDASRQAAQADRPPKTAAEPPWLADLELGRDMDDWRQMYAEERHVWEELLRAQPPGAPSRAPLERALAEAIREQLLLENALRGRQGLEPLVEDELDREQAVARQQQAAAARAGCLSLLLIAALAVLARASPPRR